VNQLLIATTNRWKAKLFEPIMSHYGFEIITLNRLKISGQTPVEDGRSVIENALIKARHYHSSEYPWVFGDDTGLEIKALNGEPGVQSRRWAGCFPDDVDDKVWLDYLLERMKDVPIGERTAEFVDGWALIEPSGTVHTCEQRAVFEIALEPIRTLLPGLPVMSVAIGLPQDPGEIFAAIKAKWDHWGIMDQLCAD
jgi:XTP/dITP diphosphohydrolase